MDVFLNSYLNFIFTIFKLFWFESINPKLNMKIKKKLSNASDDDSDQEIF